MNADQIIKIMDEFCVPKHIRRHCEKVVQVCEFIGRKISEKGDEINMELLIAGAWLHDLVRVCDFTTWNPENFPDKHDEKHRKKWEELRSKYQGKSHEESAYEILSAMGETALANLIKSHKFANILIENPFTSWEEKILYYADKRVENDKIVDLKKRLEGGAKRNADTEEKKALTLKVWPKIFELEKEICEKAGINPEELIRD